jgi:hypothetical protein
MKKGKAITLLPALLCCLFFWLPSVSFASSENWVEVLTVSGHGASFGDSPPFKINHTEWRIKWVYTPSGLWFDDFSFYVHPHYEGKPIASMRYPDETNGTLNIDYYTGIFYINVPPSGIKNWTLIVEQNTDSPIQTENWVTIATLTGQGGISSTDTFTVENNDWRIFWNVELDEKVVWPIFRAYIFPETGINENNHSIEKIERLVNEKTSGTLRVYNQSGSFHIDINASVENYRIVVQQNVDSIPEFPSWILVSLFLSSTLMIAVYREKG